jgi:uncharacterized cupin superfamily protein
MLREQLRELRRALVLKVHGSGLAVAASPAGELTDLPIDPSWIDEGSPRARAYVAVSAADHSITSGEWECTAGRFHWTYYEDEMIRILEGQALIEVDGAFRTCGPGDTIFFPLGQTVRWQVPNYVRKAFFLRKPSLLVEFLRSFQLLSFFGRGAAEHRAWNAPAAKTVGMGMAKGGDHEKERPQRGG